jgi:hypothetical protein
MLCLLDIPGWLADTDQIQILLVFALSDFITIQERSQEFRCTLYPLGIVCFNLACGLSDSNVKTVSLSRKCPILQL